MKHVEDHTVQIIAHRHVTNRVSGFLGAGKTTLLNSILHQKVRLRAPLAVALNPCGSMERGVECVDADDHAPSLLCVACMQDSALRVAVVENEMGESIGAATEIGSASDTVISDPGR